MSSDEPRCYRCGAIPESDSMAICMLCISRRDSLNPKTHWYIKAKKAEEENALLKKELERVRSELHSLSWYGRFEGIGG